MSEKTQEKKEKCWSCGKEEHSSFIHGNTCETCIEVRQRRGCDFEDPREREFLGGSVR